jgi:copper chaperone CopZ
MQHLMILLEFQINFKVMKRTLIFFSIIALMLFACKAKTTETATGENSESSDLIVNPDALVQIDLKVEGMTCTGCESTINSGVSEIAGVVEVKSSHTDGVTIVKYDSTQVNIDQISQVISGKGYIVKGYSVHIAEADTTSIIK